jgi:hypothetical protein
VFLGLCWSAWLALSAAGYFALVAHHADLVRADLALRANLAVDGRRRAGSATGSDRRGSSPTPSPTSRATSASWARPRAVLDGEALAATEVVPGGVACDRGGVARLDADAPRWTTTESCRRAPSGFRHRLGGDGGRSARSCWCTT